MSGFGESGRQLLSMLVTTAMVATLSTLAPTSVASADVTPIDTLAGEAAADSFGEAVAVDGQWMVVGGRGHAWVVQRQGDGTWANRQALIGLDGAPATRYGHAVDVAASADGSYAIAVVGDSEDSLNISKEGAVHVFEWSVATGWVAVDALRLDTPVASAAFGYSVAVQLVDANTSVIVAGAPTAAGTGRVASYVRRSGVTNAAELVDSTINDQGDHYGWSVAIDGGTLVVGAIRDSDSGSTAAQGLVGTATIYVADIGAVAAGGTAAGWTETTNVSQCGAVPTGTALPSCGTSPGEYFGSDVDIDGDTIVVGASRSSSAGGGDAGQIVVYHRVDGAWQMEKRISAPGAESTEHFGENVAVAGRLVVGTSPTRSNGGAAYAYVWDGTQYVEQVGAIAGTGAAAGDNFGLGLALESVTDTTAIAYVGAPLSDAAFTDGGQLERFLVDVPPIVDVRIGDELLPEGDSGTTDFVFTVTATPTPVAPVTVDVTMANVTTTDADLTRRTDTVTIPAGQASVDIVVPVNGDTDPEDDETFEVRLDNIRGGVLLEAVGTGTIVDDDTLPAAELTTTDGNAYESETQTEGVLFAVTPIAAATGTTVDVAVTGGTATLDDDFTVIASVPGTDGLVDITLVNDEVQEPTETVELLLTFRDGGGAQLDTATATFTIYDDDNTTVVDPPPDNRPTAGEISDDLADGFNWITGSVAEWLEALEAWLRSLPGIAEDVVDSLDLESIFAGWTLPELQEFSWESIIDRLIEFGFTLVGEPDRGGVPPVAGDDVLWLRSGATGAVNVLANDAHPDRLSFGIRNTSVGGDPVGLATAALETDGTATVTANNGFVGTTAFTYEICAAESCAEGTVQVVVTAGPPLPIVTDEWVSLGSGERRPGDGKPAPNVLVNDVSPENTPLTIKPVTIGGVVTAQQDGLISLAAVDAPYLNLDNPLTVDVPYQVCVDGDNCNPGELHVLVGSQYALDPARDFLTIGVWRQGRVYVADNDERPPNGQEDEYANNGPTGNYTVPAVYSDVFESITFTGNGENYFDVVVAPGFRGTAVFLYEACNDRESLGKRGCGWGVVEVTRSSNQGPVANNDAYTLPRNAAWTMVDLDVREEPGVGRDYHPDGKATYLAAPGYPGVGGEVGDTTLRNQEGKAVGRIVNLDNAFTLRPVDLLNPLPEHLPADGDTATFDYQLCEAPEKPADPDDPPEPRLCDTATVTITFTEAEGPTMDDIQFSAPVILDGGQWLLADSTQRLSFNLVGGWVSNGDIATRSEIAGALESDLPQVSVPALATSGSVVYIGDGEWGYETTDWSPGRVTLDSEDCDFAGICAAANVYIDLVDVTTQSRYLALPDINIQVNGATTFNPFANDVFIDNFTTEPRFTVVAGTPVAELPASVPGGTVSIVHNSLHFVPDGSGPRSPILRYNACQDRLVQLPDREVLRTSCSASFVHLQIEDDINQGPAAFGAAAFASSAAAADVPGDDELLRLQYTRSLAELFGLPDSGSVDIGSTDLLGGLADLTGVTSDALWDADVIIDLVVGIDDLGLFIGDESGLRLELGGVALANGDDLLAVLAADAVVDLRTSGLGPKLRPSDLPDPAGYLELDASGVVGLLVDTNFGPLAVEADAAFTANGSGFDAFTAVRGRLDLPGLEDADGEPLAIDFYGTASPGLITLEASTDLPDGAVLDGFAVENVQAAATITGAGVTGSIDGTVVLDALDGLRVPFNATFDDTGFTGSVTTTRAGVTVGDAPVLLDIASLDVTATVAGTFAGAVGVSATVSAASASLLPGNPAGSGDATTITGSVKSDGTASLTAASVTGTFAGVTLTALDVAIELGGDSLEPIITIASVDGTDQLGNNVTVTNLRIYADGRVTLDGGCFSNEAGIANSFGLAGVLPFDVVSACLRTDDVLSAVIDVTGSFNLDDVPFISGLTIGDQTDSDTFSFTLVADSQNETWLRPHNLGPIVIDIGDDATPGIEVAGLSATGQLTIDGYTNGVLAIGFGGMLDVDGDIDGAGIILDGQATVAGTVDLDEATGIATMRIDVLGSGSADFDAGLEITSATVDLTQDITVEQAGDDLTITVPPPVLNSAMVAGTVALPGLVDAADQPVVVDFSGSVADGTATLTVSGELPDDALLDGFAVTSLTGTATVSAGAVGGSITGVAHVDAIGGIEVPFQIDFDETQISGSLVTTIPAFILGSAPVLLQSSSVDVTFAVTGTFGGSLTLAGSFAADNVALLPGNANGEGSITTLSGTLRPDGSATLTAARLDGTFRGYEIVATATEANDVTVELTADPDTPIVWIPSISVTDTTTNTVITVTNLKIYADGEVTVDGGCVSNEAGIANSFGVAGVLPFDVTSACFRTDATLGTVIDVTGSFNLDLLNDKLPFVTGLSIGDKTGADTFDFTVVADSQNETWLRPHDFGPITLTIGGVQVAGLTAGGSITIAGYSGGQLVADAQGNNFTGTLAVAGTLTDTDITLDVNVAVAGAIGFDQATGTASLDLAAKLMASGAIADVVTVTDAEITATVGIDLTADGDTLTVAVRGPELESLAVTGQLAFEPLLDPATVSVGYDGVAWEFTADELSGTLANLFGYSITDPVLRFDDDDQTPIVTVASLQGEVLDPDDPANPLLTMAITDLAIFEDGEVTVGGAVVGSLDNLQRKVGLSDVLPFAVTGAKVELTTPNDLNSFALTVAGTFDLSGLADLGPSVSIGAGTDTCASFGPTEPDSFCFSLAIDSLRDGEIRPENFGPIHLGLDNIDFGAVQLGGSLRFDGYQNGELLTGVGGSLSVAAASGDLSASGDVDVSGILSPGLLRLDASVSVSGAVDDLVEIENAALNFGLDFVLDLESDTPLTIENVSVSGASVDRIAVHVGDIMTFEAGGSIFPEPGVLLRVDANAGESVGVSFDQADDGDAGANPLAGWGGSVGGFEITDEFDVLLLPGFSIDVETNLGPAEQPGGMGLPEWFPVSIESVGISFANLPDLGDLDIAQPTTLRSLLADALDPTGLRFRISAGLVSSEAFPITAGVDELEVDLGRLNDYLLTIADRANGGDRPFGAFPITNLDGLEFGVEPFPLGPVTVGGVLGVGLVPDLAGGQPSFYGKVNGEFAYDGFGLGIELVITDRGPLVAGIRAPLGIPLGPTGFLISGARGGINFDGGSMPRVQVDCTENPDTGVGVTCDSGPLDLIDPAFDLKDVGLSDDEIRDAIERCGPISLESALCSWSSGFTVTIGGSITHAAVGASISGNVTVGANFVPGQQLQFLLQGDITVWGQDLGTARILMDLTSPVEPVVTAAFGIPAGGDMLGFLFPGQARAGITIDYEGLVSAPALAMREFLLRLAAEAANPQSTFPEVFDAALGGIATRIEADHGLPLAVYLLDLNGDGTVSAGEERVIDSAYILNRMLGTNGVPGLLPDADQILADNPDISTEQLLADDMLLAVEVASVFMAQFFSEIEIAIRTGNIPTVPATSIDPALLLRLKPDGAADAVNTVAYFSQVVAEAIFGDPDDPEDQGSAGILLDKLNPKVLVQAELQPKLLGMPVGNATDAVLLIDKDKIVAQFEGSVIKTLEVIVLSGCLGCVLIDTGGLLGLEERTEVAMTIPWRGELERIGQVPVAELIDPWQGSWGARVGGEFTQFGFPLNDTNGVIVPAGQDGLVDNFLVPNLSGTPRPGVIADLKEFGGMYFDNQVQLPKLLTDPAEQLSKLADLNTSFPDNVLDFPDWAETYVDTLQEGTQVGQFQMYIPAPRSFPGTWDPNGGFEPLDLGLDVFEAIAADAYFEGTVDTRLFGFDIAGGHVTIDSTGLRVDAQFPFFTETVPLVLNNASVGQDPNGDPVRFPTMGGEYTLKVADVRAMLASVGLGDQVSIPGNGSATLRAYTPGFEIGSTDALKRDGGFEVRAAGSIPGVVSNAELVFTLTAADGGIGDVALRVAVGEVPVGPFVVKCASFDFEVSADGKLTSRLLGAVQIPGVDPVDATPPAPGCPASSLLVDGELTGGGGVLQVSAGAATVSGVGIDNFAGTLTVDSAGVGLDLTGSITYLGATLGVAGGLVWQPGRISGQLALSVEGDLQFGPLTLGCGSASATVTGATWRFAVDGWITVDGLEAGGAGTPPRACSDADLRLSGDLTTTGNGSMTVNASSLNLGPIRVTNLVASVTRTDATVTMSLAAKWTDPLNNRHNVAGTLSYGRAGFQGTLTVAGGAAVDTGITGGWALDGSMTITVGDKHVISFDGQLVVVPSRSSTPPVTLGATGTIGLSGDASLTLSGSNLALGPLTVSGSMSLQKVGKVVELRVQNATVEIPGVGNFTVDDITLNNLGEFSTTFTISQLGTNSLRLQNLSVSVEFGLRTDGRYWFDVNVSGGQLRSNLRNAEIITLPDFTESFRSGAFQFSEEVTVPGWSLGTAFSVDDMNLLVRFQSGVFSVKLLDATTVDVLANSGSLTLDHFEMSSTGSLSGQFSGELGIYGARLGSAGSFTLTRTGTRIRAEMGSSRNLNLGLTELRVDGWVQSDGAFSFTDEKSKTFHDPVTRQKVGRYDGLFTLSAAAGGAATGTFDGTVCLRVGVWRCASADGTISTSGRVSGTVTLSGIGTVPFSFPM